jgi:hypothetical protein
MKLLARQCLGILVCLSHQLPSSSSWTTVPQGRQRHSIVRVKLHCKEEETLLSRRRHLQTIAASLALPFLGSSPSTAADDRLFRSNPLTNSILEQFRIWDQAEADQMKYGGELERGEAKLVSTDDYAKLLVPILQVADDLQRVDALVRGDAAAASTTTDTNNNSQALDQVKTILSQAVFDKVAFKKIFNSFADNIYYSDPDRANVYLVGGAVPKSQQSLAYLLRNDILTNIEAMQAEVDFLIRNTDESKADLAKYSQQGLAAMTQYLSIVPPAEMDKAREIMKS